MKIYFTIIILFVAWNASLCKDVPAPKPFGVLPSERQLAWHETAFYAIVHLTPTTFQDKEWGYGEADPSIFNPSAFDANQIVESTKAAGMKGLVLVCKHHDGFCLWPTKTTSYNISKSPWKDGKGDMVREFRNACDKAGLKFGVYISPWDRHSAEYGNPKYVEIYREQLRELYTNYGNLFMSWHDGANGGDGYYGGANEIRQIDRTSYYGWDKLWKMTRELQSGACIFSDIGWDVRWVGNEAGFAGETCWARFTPKGREIESLPGNGISRYWEAEEGHREGKYWMPAECDVPLRSGWFYHKSSDNQVKTPYQLFDLYCKSIGRGQGLDLGLSPDLRGLLHDNDVAALKGMGELIEKTFAVNLARTGNISLSNIRGRDNRHFGMKNLLDTDRYSYWATDDSVTTPHLILEMKNSISFNIIKIRENIKLGQRIDQIGIDVWVNSAWHEVATATSIGALRIIRLPDYKTTTKLRLRVVRSAAAPCISEFGVYAEPVRLTPPAISRSIDGVIQMTTQSPVPFVCYTIDGTDPSINSTRYQQPFELKSGGVIKARSFDHKGNQSDQSTKEYGIYKKEWKLIFCSFAGKDGEGSKAFDENPMTIWHSFDPDNLKRNTPQEIAVDMGHESIIESFTYLPRQDGKIEGIIDQYEFFLSCDAKSWEKVAAGEFANIKSNPVEQIIGLTIPVNARYFKFRGVRNVSNSYISTAEIGIKVKSER